MLQMVLVLFGTSVILFLALFVVPGDPFGTVPGTERARTQEVKEYLEQRYGRDQPLPAQYLRYASGVVRGDLGTSYRDGKPVSQILRETVPATAQLAVAAIVLMLLIGGAAGLIAAVFRQRFWDVLVTLTTTLAIAVPSFVIGRVLQDVFGLQLHWLPRTGQGGLAHLVLPALTLASVDAALVARLMRGAVLEVGRADHVRTALGKGLSRRAVLFKHVVRNSIIPVVTYVGIAFGGLLGGALITETIFQWPGIGSTLVVAIQEQNHPVILAAVTYGVIAFVVVNLLVDIVYAYLDPRIRLE
jgi:oligopeptide transport system permease protein